ncbi:MAG: FAD-binding and (Fe-S)-binding domain-containing protein [Gemmataceae bacterium]
MRITELPVLSESATSPARQPDLARLRAELEEVLQGESRFDRLGRALYATDASIYQIVPAGVVLPRTAADIVATVQACARAGVPITARGGGTSQAGQAIGPGVILDCSKYYHRILEINADEHWVRVEPGCVLDDLNARLKPYGLHFPLDISTSDRATIGGMIANNSSGTHSLLYGKTIDHVRELTVVRSDGKIMHCQPLDQGQWAEKARKTDHEGECHRVVTRLAAEHAAEIDRRYPKILRRVGGYNLDRFLPGQPSINLAHLLVGSEGTLGITLDAKLNLMPLPRAKGMLVIQFAELLEALAATPLILNYQPSAVEVVDRYILDSTKLNPEAARLRDFLDGDPEAILIVEFYGDSAADLSPRLEALRAELVQRGIGQHYHPAHDAAEQGRIWKLRRLALGLSMAEKGDAKAISFVEDTAVAPEKLRDYIAELLEVVRRHGTKAGVYAHASVGCLHVRPVVNLKTEAGVRQFEAIAAETAELVLKYGGALSGEHGDGLVRSPFQEKMFGPVLYQAFREIKRVFDPRGIFNPGKIVDAPPLSANLRYGPAYVTPNVPTTFDFSADGGLTQAAELCAGVGECRGTRGGNMCPSYRATREEQHATRGRANTLRLALTGQLGFQGFTDPHVKEALDLCLECKACKSECPTNVDMARLKAEFLHQYFQRHGLPWRNWLFGHIARLSRWGRLVNFLTRRPLFRWLNERLFGIDARRLPPAVVARRDRLSRRFLADATAHGGTEGRHTVLLFPDTFAEYYEPDIALAVRELLRPLQWEVELGRQDANGAVNHLVCCGRPYISNGMLDQAVRCARRNTQQLYPWAAAGKPIIACEPSCILTIQDDYPALLRGEERRQAEIVASVCRTFEEHLCDLLHQAERASTLGVEIQKELGQDALEPPLPGDNSEGKYVGSVTPTLPAPLGDEVDASQPPSPEEQSVLVELAERALQAVQPASLSFRAGPRKILVQHHCHQRALTGSDPLVRLLRQIPSAEVIDLDAGCCGMAGSFGYEKEHYDLARWVGEHQLFPTLRQADEETVIVASGFSCRMQIAHFTGKTALHPALLLRELMEK